MKKPVVFGLIGAGGIGAYHRAAIENLERQGLAKLVAVADPLIQKLGSQKDELKAKGIRWYPEFDEMLNAEPSIQAVAIATPIPFHYEMALACIQRKLFVVLEKPPVPLLSQMDALIEADVDKRVCVGFQMIGSSSLQEVKRLATSGQLGKLREIRAAACWPRLDGYYQRASWAGRLTVGDRAVFDGPATNALAHLVNGISFLAGERMRDFSVPSFIKSELYRARPIESYDTVSIRGEFPSNIAFSLAATHATHETSLIQIEIRGSQGWAKISEDGATVESNRGLAFRREENTQLLLDRYYDQVIRFIDGHAVDFPPSLRDTQPYVATTNAMLRSAGGIKDIDRAFVDRYIQAGDEGYHVEGLTAAVAESLRSGRLFSEQDLPWASCEPTQVSLEGSTSLHLSDLQQNAPETGQLHAA